MEYRRLGATDMEVSVLGLGAAPLGYGDVTPPEAERIVHGGLDAGLNAIDTAASYGDSEEKLGRALEGVRDRVFLFTKTGPDWNPDIVQRNIERSLRRLRTDHVDLLQIWSAPEDVVRKGQVTELLLKAKEKGQTRFIGYSGDGEAALAAVESDAFDVLQISINLADQEGIEKVLPAARERDMGVIAKRPLANVAWLDKRAYFPGYERVYRTRLRTLDYEILKGSREHTISVALRFPLAVPGVHTAIAGTTKPGRYEENARLLEEYGPLDDEAYRAIRDRWQSLAPASWTGQR